MKQPKSILPNLFTLLFCVAVGFKAAAAGSTLTDAEKIKLIMSVAEKAKEPRNFYRWQSETSGNNLLAAGDYNEKLFKYFMNMPVDADHFAGGRGVYYAEDISSSAQFIRGDGKGSLIEVRIPKGMPTLDLTDEKTKRKLTQLGVTPNDVLTLDPPLAVRYSANGWWAVKRREGVKFQPFKPDKMPIQNLLSAFTAVEAYPRAAEVLEPYVVKRIEADVKKNVGVLVSQPKLQRFVSKETLTAAIAKSPELLQFLKSRFLSEKFDELPANHFGVIVTAVRKSGVAVDESPLFRKLGSRQKIAYLDEMYPEFSAHNELVKALLSDDEIRGAPFKLKSDELRKVERHVLPALERNPELMIEFPKAYHLLSSENLVSLLKKNDFLQSHLAEKAAKPGFDLPLTRNVGEFIEDLKAGGVLVDDEKLFRHMWLNQRLQYLNHFFPSNLPPTEMIDELVSTEGLRYLSISATNIENLKKTLSRFAATDGSFLIKSPSAFQYLESEVLRKVVAENEAVRSSLYSTMLAGKFAAIDGKSVTNLQGALGAAGQTVSDEVLFKNLDLEAKLAFLNRNFSKKKIPVPATFIRALIDDDAIQRNSQISDQAALRLGAYINDALAEFTDDLDLLERASRLYSFDKMKVDGRALIGYELRSKDARAKQILDQYAWSYLKKVNLYSSEPGARETQAKVFNSLVGGRFSSWDHSLYEKLSDWPDRNKILTPENKLILEESLVEDLSHPNAREPQKLAKWLVKFVKEPSDQTAATLYARCQAMSTLHESCASYRTDSINIYEKSAIRVLGNSPEEYVKAMKRCLESTNCWTLRALSHTVPPKTLSFKQVSELMAAYKAAPVKEQVNFNSLMIEIASPHWRSFQDDYRSLFNSFPNGVYPTYGSDEIRIRRASAIREVGEALSETLTLDQIKLANAINLEFFMDIAHERDSKKPDYDRLIKLEMTDSKLRSLAHEMVHGEKKSVTKPVEVKAPSKVEIIPPTKLETAPPPIAAEPPKNQCATLFQKLGQFLKRRGR